jgi:protoporphyrinogen oxidase
MKKEVREIIKIIKELTGEDDLAKARETSLSMYKSNKFYKIKNQDVFDYTHSCQVGVLFGLLSRLGLWDDYNRKFNFSTGVKQ